MLLRISHLVSAAILLCSFTYQTPLAYAQPGPPGSSSTHAKAVTRAHAAAVALTTLYNRDTGLFNTTGWWNSANATTALADESRVTRDRSHDDLFRNTFQQAPRKFPAFLNDFYDDEGWWALTWIDVYDLDPHAPDAKRYLRASKAIFTDMTGAWDQTCGGGIWWSKERKYKNAIANELFLSVAAQLAMRTHRKERRQYLGWAQREWTWFSHSGMINADSLINDGLTIDPADRTCRNNGKTAWTYNQGVILGGLAALYDAGKPPALLPVATRIALAAITHLTDSNGLLHDPCEPKCGEDGVQFKGIFTRNLAQLQAVAPNPAFTRFLQANADSLWLRARTPGNRFSTVWSGPPGEDNAGAQASALDVLTAAASVTRP